MKISKIVHYSKFRLIEFGLDGGKKLTFPNLYKSNKFSNITFEEKKKEQKENKNHTIHTYVPKRDLLRLWSISF